MENAIPFPATDISQLADEVMSRGPLAALPHNLSDHWLRAVARDLQQARLGGRDPEPASDDDVAAPVLLVLALLSERHRDDSSALATMSPAAFMDALRKFEMAVMEEIVARQTGVFLHRHTVADIVGGVHAPMPDGASS